MEPVTCPTCGASLDRAICDGDAYQCGRCQTSATIRLIETPDGPIWFWQQVRPSSARPSSARLSTTGQPA